MKKTYCPTCYVDTWHNKAKQGKKDANEWRCTQCGFPRRTGAKNVVRLGGKIICQPAGG